MGPLYDNAPRWPIVTHVVKSSNWTKGKEHGYGLHDRGHRTIPIAHTGFRSQLDFKHVGLSRESRALRPSLLLDFSSDKTLPSLRIAT